MTNARAAGVRHSSFVVRPLIARRPALAVFLLLFGIYILTTGGHQYAVDEERMFAATESLALHGSFALNAGSGGAPKYSTYGPAQSIAAVPFYIVGRGLAAFWPAEAYPWVTRLAVSWFNPVVTALVAALIVVAASTLGYSRQAAVGAALLYGLGTMAWPHSKTFFAEPLTALVLFAAFVLSVQARSQKLQARLSILQVIASGVLAGIAPAIKIQAGLALPLLALFVLIVNNQEPRTENRQSLFLVLGSRFSAFLTWLAAALLPLLLLAVYQWILFGSPLRSGYGDVGGGFTTPFWLGFGGQLWSFGRGIVWYAPLLLLAPLGAWRMWHDQRAVVLLCLGMFAAHILFYATWWAWDGAGAWGPRFLNVALPFLALLVVGVVERRPTTGNQRPANLSGDHRSPVVGRLIVNFLLALTIPVQIAGLSINLNSYFSLTRGTDVSVWRPADSAIAVHLLLFSERVRGLYQHYFAPNSVVLQSGFSYSEGAPIADPRWGEKLGLRQPLPRWTSDRAVIVVRSDNQTVELHFSLNGCAAPVAVRVQVFKDGHELNPAGSACPSRSYTLVLPQSSRLELRATGWNPAAYGGERDETLGVRLESLAGIANNRPLAIQAETAPIPPMPNEVATTKYWMLDHRYAHWDYWWWYFVHNRYPATVNLAFGGLWLVIGLSCAIVGCLTLLEPKSGSGGK